MRTRSQASDLADCLIIWPFDRTRQVDGDPAFFQAARSAAVCGTAPANRLRNTSGSLSLRAIHWSISCLAPKIM